MVEHRRAGQRCEERELVDLSLLTSRYYTPDSAHYVPRVSFGTSGHRGSSLHGSFHAVQVAALVDAIVALRASWGATGPLFVGADSHALSTLALQTVRDVLQHQDVDVRYAPDDTLIATPVISHTILSWNREHPDHPADGIILTPSHNPPHDGGFKYNPPTGGPATPDITDAIAAYTNAQLAREPHARTPAEPVTSYPTADMIGGYVDALQDVINIPAIQRADLSIGVDPLGGASLPVWKAIAARYGLNVHILNEQIDPQFAFMHLDHDGVIRMDCSSPWAMRGVVEHAANYDVCVGHDPDADRHGIVTAKGVMNPNRFLSLAVDHLLRTRTDWAHDVKIGRTVVTSSMLDRVAAQLGYATFETPVGFKWFVDGLNDGSLVFGGEESAGASFVQFDGRPWSTDKDGIIMGLLAAEIVATRGQDLDAYWAELTAQHGQVYYARRDRPASAAVRQAVKTMTQESITRTRFAGHPITQISTVARGNGAPIGGMRIDTAHGWVAMRPSGTEDILKIYAESFVDDAHLQQLLDEASHIVEETIGERTDLG